MSSSEENKRKVFNGSRTLIETCIPEKLSVSNNLNNLSRIDIPEMLTIRELSARTGFSYDFLRKLCLQRKIVFIRTGSKYLINYQKFVEFLNRGDMD